MDEWRGIVSQAIRTSVIQRQRCSFSLACFLGDAGLSHSCATIQRALNVLRHPIIPVRSAVYALCLLSYGARPRALPSMPRHTCGRMATHGEPLHMPSPSPLASPPKCELCASTMQPPPPAYEPRGAQSCHCHCRCQYNCDKTEAPPASTNQTGECEAGNMTTEPKRLPPPPPLASCLGSLIVLAAIIGAIYGLTQWAKHENHQAVAGASSRISEKAALSRLVWGTLEVPVTLDDTPITVYGAASLPTGRPGGAAEG